MLRADASRLFGRIGLAYYKVIVPTFAKRPGCRRPDADA